MNAISNTASLQAPELPTDDLGILQHLIALSLQLADLAFRQAHEEEKAQTPEQPGKEPRRPGRPDSRLIFLRLRRAIQETIAFKNRLAAGMKIEASYARRQVMPRPAPEPAIAPSTTPAEGSRRAPIARYFREAINITEKKRKIPITLQDVDTCIDAELAKDPDHRLQGRSILLKVCKSLDLPFYANRMSPELFRPAPAPAPAPA